MLSTFLLEPVLCWLLAAGWLLLMWDPNGRACGVGLDAKKGTSPPVPSCARHSGRRTTGTSGQSTERRAEQSRACRAASVILTRPS